MFKNRFFALGLLVVAALSLTLSILYLNTTRYTHTEAISDSGTSYWRPSDGPCGADQRETKRPIRTVYAASSFYAQSFWGIGGITTDINKVERWQAQQGNCPYQVMDVYKTGQPYDLYLLTTLSGGLGMYILVSTKKKTK